MLRFICFLLGKSYEPCKSCETFRKELEYVRGQNKELLDSILNIAKPTIVQMPDKSIEPVLPKTIPWRIKQEQLEQRDRMKARQKIANPDIADKIDELEAELLKNEAGS